MQANNMRKLLQDLGLTYSVRNLTLRLYTTTITGEHPNSDTTDLSALINNIFEFCAKYFAEGSE